jgi:uncharacterized protein
VITDYLARLFARSRLILLIGVLAVTAMAVRGYMPDPPEVPEAPDLAPAVAENEQKPKERPARERIESEFNLTQADCLLIVDADELFTPRTMEAVRQMVRDLEALDVVETVVWLETVPILNIFGLPDPLLPPEGSSAERLQIARERALNHPLVAGQLLSDDGNALQMPIRFDWLFVTGEDSGAPEVLQAARESLDRSLSTEAGTVRLQMTGRIPLWKAERDAFSSDHRKYQIIAYSMILILAVLLFRGLVPVMIVAAAPALAVFWTFGLLGFFNHETNDMTSVVMPVLIAMVSFTDGVHLMIHIRRKRSDGLSPIDSAASAIRHVGMPCFLTSLTTAIGFGSLLLSSSEYIREFGTDCALGVMCGFVAVVTVIPLLSSTWLGRNLASRHEDDLVARSLDRLSPAVEWIQRRAKPVSAAGVLFACGLAVYASQLRPDEKWEYSMPTGTAAYKAMAWCDEAFGGIEFAHATIHWTEEQAESPGEILEAIREVQRLVQSEPLLKHPMSIDDMLRTFPSDTDDPETLMSFAELLPPPLRNLLYDPEQRKATVLMRCQDRGIRHYAPVFERLDAHLVELAGRNPEFFFELGGSPVWRSRNLYKIVVDLASSLGTASLIILVIMAFVYRSVRIGLIAVVPNLLPLIVTASLLVMTDFALNIAAVCAFTVCLGIAVDDTIHFLSRFQDEMSIHDDVGEAVRRSFLGVGTALVTTTVVLVCGFATVLASQMPSHRIFAGMAVSTIGSALIADLILLPALLSAFYKPKKYETADGLVPVVDEQPGEMPTGWVGSEQ